ncbi:hypothetical protein D3OALGA1CA_5390 [Olavius algarvensis associated proteobacterium Delta 3]|nr:hypothetical protein D3OALGB2SA_1537 [Olavius algarvensis associated proteobacterium Delta 3]CAB5166026.1 hypothetical protein D3OALGA1CA_5390 [Olavius algarvensis associated proteobacterium Delta 3]
MPGLPTFDGDNIDLYMQLLSDAQRLEDKKMIRMIVRQLRVQTGRTAFPENSDGVIPFPCAATGSACAVAEVEFWKDSQFWTDLVQFIVVLIAGLSWFTLPLLLNAFILHG